MKLKLIGWWHSVNDWVKALLIALLALALLHCFVLRWVTVRSTSMYATLLPGDLVGVTRWNTWTGLDRNAVAVFHDPVQDDKPMARRTLLVKRIVGLPGDVVEVRQGELLVNNKPVPAFPGETSSWLLRVEQGVDPKALLKEAGLSTAFVLPDQREVELPLTVAMAADLRARTGVVSVQRLRLATGTPRHIFPYSPFYKWNSDNYGPIVVPRQGDRVRLDARTLPLYDRLVTHYEGNKVEASGNSLYINGQETDSYQVQQDYYFVLGDSRHYSADSRYWGFVPHDHLVGRAAFVLLSSDEEAGGLRSDRWFTGIP